MTAPTSPDAAPRKKPGPPKGDPRMVEAGRRGGARVRETHGPAFFQAIGQKGGRATRARYGPEFFSTIGRKGGETVRQTRGIDFYAVIGRKGGHAPTRPHD
jgi:general stress protein YciG